MHPFRHAFPLLLLCVCAGCGTAQIAVVPPDVPQERLSEPRPAHTAFACDLYRRLATSEDGDVVCSPFSLSMALAMARAGAAGETAAQMDAVLRIAGDDPSALHDAYAALAARLRPADASNTLNIANALWGQRGFPFEDEFRERLARSYGAGFQSFDFSDGGERERARREINRWVAERTQAKIRELIAPGFLQEDTRLLLTNAVSFDGKWAEAFDATRTNEQPFHVGTGATSPCRMMSATMSVPFLQTEHCRIADIPYRGDDLAMTIVVPERLDGLQAIEGALDAAQVEGWTATLREQEVVVEIPRWTSRSRIGLKQHLQGMGMGSAFDPQRADFSAVAALTEGERLFIADVLQEAWIEVEEEGTKAAAATAVGFGITSAASEPARIRADRPFLYLIRHRPTGCILFIGRVTRPQDP